MSVQPNTGNPPEGGEAIKQFQLTASVDQKSTKEFGLAVGKYISNTTDAGAGYYFERNARFKKNRDAANGRMNIEAMFRDRLGFNAKDNFINISYKAPLITNTIISKLVGRWMGNNEKIIVTATDSLSVQDKMDGYAQAEFVMENKKKLEQLSQQSGVDMIPKDQFVAEDQQDLFVWASHYQRLPEEILFESGMNDVLDSEGLFDELKEMALWELSTTLFGATETWMDEEGVIHVELFEGENAIYSSSNYPDFRDTTWRGRAKMLKISELRARYSVECGGEMTEKQIWDIAATSNENSHRGPDKLTWTDNWANSALRPYDEWSVKVIVFEMKTLDVDPKTIVTTKKNKSVLVKNGKPNKLADNEEYIEEKKWNIYRGVFVRSPEVLLEWGLKKNMIRPKDPKEIGEAEFSFSFVMPQQYLGRNIAIPEKIEEPVEEMILTRLKIQQLIAKMRPNGSAINADALREMDLGLADGTKPLDIKTLFDQTGDLYYSGKDAEGNPIPLPITAAPDDGFFNKLQGLIQTYQFHYQVLKDELGEDPSLGSALGRPRVTTDNAKSAMAETENATSYIYEGYLNLMEQTAKKIGMLMYDSVIHGAEAYRHIMGAEDIEGRVFSTTAKMMPTEVQIQTLEQSVANAMIANPDLVMYCSSAKVAEIAKEDVKLAYLYFENCQKKAIKGAQDTAAQNAQVNGQVQQQALQAKGQMDAQMAQMKAEIDMKVAQASGDMVTRNTVLASIMKMYETGVMIPAQLMPLAQAVLETVALPAMIENQDMRTQINQQMQQAAAQQAQQQAPPGQGQPQQADPNQQPIDPQQQNAA